jgi:hypothetical protein
MNKSIPEIQSRQEKEIVQQLHAAAPQPPHLDIYVYILYICILYKKKCFIFLKNKMEKEIVQQLHAGPEGRVLRCY